MSWATMSVAEVFVPSRPALNLSEIPVLHRPKAHRLPVIYRLVAGTVLLFKPPVVDGHVLGGHPFDVPVKVQAIASLSVALPCDASAPGYVLTVR